MNYFDRLKKLLIPKDDDLHVDWIRKFNLKTGQPEGQRIYIAVCKCGSKSLLKAEKGIRCQECGAFHTHDAFYRVMEKAKKMALGNTTDSRILQVIEDKLWKDKVQNRLIKMGLIKKKIIV